jgi:hypothetical protein
MTYVSGQTSAELREHMRRLKKMHGWHEPLADRLFREIERQDAEIDRLRAALIGERERCARHVELIAADWREYQKVWASEYLARQIRDLPASTESAAKKPEDVG